MYVLKNTDGMISNENLLIRFQDTSPFVRPRNRRSVIAARKIIIQNGAKYKWNNWQNALTVEEPGFVACVSIELTTLALLAPLSTTWANKPRPTET